MPEEDGCRVRDLLPDRFDDLDTVVKQELRGPNGEPGDPPAVAMKVLGEQAAKAVQDALDCDLFETLAQGWLKAKELREYADPKKHPPGERSTVFLAEHKLKTQLHPVLDVNMAPLWRGKLKLTVELKADFRCANLTILDGRIVEIAAGDCQAVGQLKYGSTNLHKPLKSRTFTLSRPRVLAAPGLAIG